MIEFGHGNLNYHRRAKRLPHFSQQPGTKYRKSQGKSYKLGSFCTIKIAQYKVGFFTRKQYILSWQGSFHHRRIATYLSERLYLFGYLSSVPVWWKQHFVRVFNVQWSSIIFDTHLFYQAKGRRSHTGFLVCFLCKRERDIMRFEPAP